MRFDADGTGTKRIEMRVRIQSDGALQELGQLILNYDSDFEKMTFTGRLRGPTGSSIEIPASAIQDMSSPVSRYAPMYSDIRQKHVIVPGLRPGLTLEYVIQLDRFAALAPGHFWAMHDFELDDIVESEELSISVPADKYVNVKSPKNAPHVEDRDGRRVYTWKSSHLKREERSDKPKNWWELRFEEKEPAVQLSTFRTWAEVGEWYAGLEKDRRVPDEGIRLKVLQLTAAAESELPKLEAIYDHVAKSYRYVSLSFGIGRYQPHRASEIFGNQYGDCKDKHTLLAAMAQVAGLQAQAALISSTRKIDPTFPSPAQFDHVISYVPLGAEEVWLDTTTEVAPFRMLLQPLRRKTALVVVSNGKSHLRDTPGTPAIQNTSVTTVNGAISELGTLSAEVVLTLRGDAEVVGRLGARALPQARWTDFLEMMLAELGMEGDVSNVEIVNLDDTKKPLEFRLHLSRSNFLNRFETNPSIELPLGEGQSIGPEEAGEEKTFDVVAGRFEYHLRIKLPRQFAARMPVPIELRREFGDYRSAYSMQDDVVIASRTLNVTVGELPATRFDEFKAFRKAVAADAKQRIGVRIEGLRAMEGAGDVKADELLEAAASAFDSQRFQESIDLVERVLKLEPNHKTAYSLLGQAYLGLAKMDQAEEALKKAVTIDPFTSYAYNTLGAVCRMQQRYQEAEKWFLKQIEIDPLDEWAHKNLGEILVEQKKYEQALPELEKASVITPTDGRVLLELGRAHMELGRTSEARDSFRRAVELSPSPSVWNDIAYTLAEHDMSLDQAREYAESAVAMVSAQLRNAHLEALKAEDLGRVIYLARVWDTLGWVHFKRGEFKSAERYIRAAWQLAQEGAMAAHLGQVYERLGQTDLAKEYYAYSTIDSFPPHEGRKHLEALIGPKASAYVDSMRTRPGEQRTYTVPGATGEGNADFYVALAPGPRVMESRFISGDLRMRGLGEALKRVKFILDFPSGTDTRVIRRGILSCSISPTTTRSAPKSGPASKQALPEAGPGSTCVFVLLEPSSIPPPD